MEGSVHGNINTASINNGLKKVIKYEHGTKEYFDITDNEIMAYAEHIKSVIPASVQFDLTTNIYKQLRDGVVLSHFLNHIEKGLVRLSKIKSNLDMEKQNGLFEASINLSNVLEGSKRCGVCVVNIGPEDILYENRNLILGLLWQLVKKSITNASKIMVRPELVNLLKETENLFDITQGKPETILLRWVNYHLEQAHKQKYVSDLKLLTNSKVERLPKDLVVCVPHKCTNFGPDLRDSKIYLLILKQVAGSFIPDDLFLKAFIEKDCSKRAESVVNLAERLECKKFISAEAIIAGDTKLNFLFMATIFDKYIGFAKNQTNEFDDMKKQLEKLNLEKHSLEETIKSLKNQINLSKNEMEEESNHNKNGIEIRKHIYNKALEEHNASLEVFSEEIISYCLNLGYVYNDINVSSPIDKIMFTLNALTNELEKLRIENKDLKQLDVIIEEVFMKLEKKVETYIDQKRRTKKSCLSFFTCN